MLLSDLVTTAPSPSRQANDLPHNRNSSLTFSVTKNGKQLEIISGMACTEEIFGTRLATAPSTGTRNCSELGRTG